MSPDLYAIDEHDLIDAVLNGNGEGYRVLLDRYSSMVFHIVRKFERDEGEAEELAQQIFVKAYDRLGLYDKKSKFSSWLYSLSMNHCRDYLKNIRRKNVRLGEYNVRKATLIIASEVESPKEINGECL